MTEQDLNLLADKMWERASKARSFTNKQVWFLAVAVFIFASSLGMTWNKILRLPEITNEQWENVYSYSVLSQADRERKYSEIINSFTLINQKQDIFIASLSQSYNEVKTDVKDIKESLTQIEKHIK